MLFENKIQYVQTLRPADLLFDPGPDYFCPTVENPEHLHVVMISLNSTG